jgi:thioredoxin-like negative regulator of GroEL
MRRSLVAVALTLVLAPPASTAEPPARIAWTTSFASALAKAGAKGKPLMVEFWADWCGWCHVFERTTFSNADVARLASDFVAVRIDTEGPAEQVKVAERYGITGLPTILFLSPSGRPVLRVSGYQKPADFARTLQSARQESAKVAGLERAIAAQPDNAEPLLQLGLRALDTEAIDDAQSLLVRAYHVDARLPVADRKRLRLVLGAMRRVERKYDESETLLKEALALAPADPETDPQLLLTLGRLYASWDRPADALKVLRRLVRDYPKSAAAARAQQVLAYLEASR